MRLWVLFLAGATLLTFVMGCGGNGGGSSLADFSPGGPDSRVAAIGTSSGSGIYASNLVVLGYNDLGMHCMNKDFSRFMVLPPANTMHATVIDRSGEHPKIVTSGVTLNYAVPGNTRSANKINFWQYAPALLGVTLPPDKGVTGNGLSGTMKPRVGHTDWEATAIPITQITDAGTENSYQLATITATQNGRLAARTKAVIPVSWEMSCNLCHTAAAGETVDQAILRAHDKLHGTTLLTQSDTKPVLCGSCHAQAPLGLPGKAGIPSLSAAMHGAHAPRMGAVAGKLSNSCYACHPGMKTQCQRDIHSIKGMTCVSCHTSMEAVANPARRPWVDEPRCGSCHNKAGHEYEQAGTLFRDSKGHHGVQCSACHGSPHAITPTTQANDNVQAIGLQGTAGVISKCAVCHSQPEGDPFDHRLTDQ